MWTRTLKVYKGHTLVELIIGSALFLIFTSMIFGLYLLGYNSWKRADAKMQTKRAAVLSMEDISKSMSHTQERSVRVVYYHSLNPFSKDFATPPNQAITARFCAISCLSPYDEHGNFVVTPGSQEPLWKAYLIFYVNPADGTLRKKRIEINVDTDDPKFGDPLGEDALISHLDGDGKILAEDITKFRVMDILEEPPKPIKEIFNPLCVQILVEKVSTREDKPEVTELTRLMRMYEKK